MYGNKLFFCQRCFGRRNLFIDNRFLHFNIFVKLTLTCFQIRDFLKQPLPLYTRLDCLTIWISFSFERFFPSAIGIFAWKQLRISQFNLFRDTSKAACSQIILRATRLSSCTFSLKQCLLIENPRLHYRFHGKE